MKYCVLQRRIKNLKSWSVGLQIRTPYTVNSERITASPALGVTLTKRDEVDGMKWMIRISEVLEADAVGFVVRFLNT